MLASQKLNCIDNIMMSLIKQLRTSQIRIIQSYISFLISNTNTACLLLYPQKRYIIEMLLLGTFYYLLYENTLHTRIKGVHSLPRTYVEQSLVIVIAVREVVKERTTEESH
jgi:hypothetical protein